MGRVRGRRGERRNGEACEVRGYASKWGLNSRYSRIKEISIWAHRSFKPCLPSA
ncbi:MAG: hypothetical protein ACKESB_03130 [Candidatus Hodgkinia cicadicola]